MIDKKSSEAFSSLINIIYRNSGTCTLMDFINGFEVTINDNKNPPNVCNFKCKSLNILK